MKAHRAHMKSMPTKTVQTSAKSCPICGKPAVPESRPFCSRRCADVDLNRWLSGVYTVPVREADDEDGIQNGDRVSEKREGPAEGEG
jgi:endogenous inhibitor of DNA gyrase (YacG/DUF329 family)